jgi:hypothetical protein
VSTILALMAAEVTLRLLEPRIGSAKFELLRRATAESFYYHHHKQLPVENDWPAFDRTLGWRNTARRLPDGQQETLNSERWRSKTEYDPIPSKRRVILTGDSFTYGWWVNDDETVSAYLQQELGPDVEVLNMGARGYGLDQMALVATKVAPHYLPDSIVIAFIEDDLRRSCYDFYLFRLRKPRFVWQGDRVVPAGIPVPSPIETLAEHQRPAQRVVDAVAAHATRFRTACLVTQIPLQLALDRCLTDLNAAILRYIVTESDPKVRKIIVHLDGTLPRGFEAKVRELPVVYVSVPGLVPALSAELGVPAERHRDGHPKPGLNRIYGRAIATALRDGVAGGRVNRHAGLTGR